MHRFASVVVVCAVSFVSAPLVAATKLDLSAPSFWNTRHTALPPNPTLIYSTGAHYRVGAVRYADGRELSFRDRPLCRPASWVDARVDAMSRCDESSRADRTRVVTIEASEPGVVEIALDAPNHASRFHLVTVDSAWRAPAVAYEMTVSRFGVTVESKRQHSSTRDPFEGSDSRLWIRPMALAYEVISGPGGRDDRRADQRGAVLALGDDVFFPDISRESVVRITPLWQTGMWGTPWEGKPYDLPVADTWSMCRAAAPDPGASGEGEIGLCEAIALEAAPARGPSAGQGRAERGGSEPATPRGARALFGLMACILAGAAAMRFPSLSASRLRALDTSSAPQIATVVAGSAAVLVTSLPIALCAAAVAGAAAGVTRRVQRAR